MSKNGIELMVKKGISKGFKAESTIVAIAYGAFDFDARLVELDLPSSLLAIQGHAFDACHNLRKIIFREGLLKIGEGAFLGCEKLKKVTLPKSLKELGYGAFAGCYGLEEAALSRRTKGRRTAFDGATEVTIVDPLPWATDFPRGVLPVSKRAGRSPSSKK